jgi:hypothetical protein
MVTHAIARQQVKTDTFGFHSSIRGAGTPG